MTVVGLLTKMVVKIPVTLEPDEAASQALMLKGPPPATVSSSISVSSTGSQSKCSTAQPPLFLSTIRIVAGSASGKRLPLGSRAAAERGICLRSRHSDVLVGRIRLGELGSISEGGAQGETNGGANGGADSAHANAEGIAAGHGVKLALVQFNKFIHV